MLVVAEQRRRDLFHPVYGVFGHVNASGLSAARASGRNNFVSGVAVSIQILLHMGNDLIALAHLDAAPRRQLQILNEGEVMEARPGYRAAVDLHRIEDGNWGNFPCAAGCPLDRAQDRFIGIVLKLECEAVFIVVSGPAAGLCVGSIIVGNHDAIDGNIMFLRVFPQMLNTGIHIELRHRPLVRQILADGKAEQFNGPKALRLPRIVCKALQNIERHEGHAAVLAGAAVQQADGAGREIASVFVGLSVPVPQRIL